MKYSMSSRQTQEYLEKADEIRFEYRDYRSLSDYIEKYPDKQYNLWIPSSQEEVDWEEIRIDNILAQGRLVCCVGKIEHMRKCIELDIRFFYGYPITSYAELHDVINMGVCYIRLGEPLFFDLERIKSFGIPVRAVPNVAYLDYFPRPDGVTGTWIRPEDVAAYENYIEYLEFEDCDIRKEQALFRIYAEDKEWPGDMNMIISNLNHPALNRLVDSEATENRRFCGQRCKRTGTCQLCYTALNLAIREKIEAYKAFLEEKAGEKEQS